MANNIGDIMGQCPQRKGVFIDVSGFGKQGFDKVSAADIVDHVTEHFIAERIVAHVLYEASSIRKRVRLAEIILR